MSSLIQQNLRVGQSVSGRDIAVLQRPGRQPGIFWLNGFRSVMTGAKASALDQFGAENALAVTRFDYSGHGASGGQFEDGTISRWLEETEAVFALTQGPQIVVGSSMGGWLALLLARRLLGNRDGRLKGLVLIAPAVDATETLIPARLGPGQHLALERDGFVELDSRYGDGPYRYSQALLDDGKYHLLLGSPIETGCPVTILQGGRDPDVPSEHAQKLLIHILHDPVTFTLIPDGDHRLSRPEDLDRLKAAVRAML
jgi:pimeloyl-ACP methyl ester carboxylesterase